MRCRGAQGICPLTRARAAPGWPGRVVAVMPSSRPSRPGRVRVVSPSPRGGAWGLKDGGGFWVFGQLSPGSHRGPSAPLASNCKVSKPPRGIDRALQPSKTEHAGTVDRSSLGFRCAMPAAEPDLASLNAPTESRVSVAVRVRPMNSMERELGNDEVRQHNLKPRIPSRAGRI